MTRMSFNNLERVKKVKIGPAKRQRQMGRAIWTAKQMQTDKRTAGKWASEWLANNLAVDWFAADSICLDGSSKSQC